MIFGGEGQRVGIGRGGVAIIDRDDRVIFSIQPDGDIVIGEHSEQHLAWMLLPVLLISPPQDQENE
jgi:hypothetical protein